MTHITQNTTPKIEFVLVDAAGVEVTGLGGGFTVTLSKNGGAFGASAGSKAEIGSGWYRYTPTAAETNTVGPLALAITGAGALQQNLLFDVEAAPAVPSTVTAGVYTTLAAVKALLPQNNFGTTLDPTLNAMIVDASRMIDAHLGREPGSFAVADLSTRYFDGNGKQQLFIGEMAALPTTVLVAETGLVDTANGTGGTYTAWALTDLIAEPYNALSKRRPINWLTVDVLQGTKSYWYPYRKAVKITSLFGYATTSNTPEEIQHATEVQAMRYFKRASQSYQDVGAITELGQLQYVKELDPEVKHILAARKFRCP